MLERCDASQWTGVENYESLFCSHSMVVLLVLILCFSPFSLREASPLCVAHKVCVAAELALRPVVSAACT